MSSARVGWCGRGLGGSAPCSRIPEAEEMARGGTEKPPPRPSPPGHGGRPPGPLPRAARQMLLPATMLRLICAIPHGQSRAIPDLDGSCCGSSTSLPPSCPHQKHS